MLRLLLFLLEQAVVVLDLLPRVIELDAALVQFGAACLDFLPAQWLVRVGETTASMTMGRYFDGVWLPKAIEFRGDVQFALGAFEAEYTREFLEYRKAETSARIRGYGDVK